MFGLTYIAHQPTQRHNAGIRMVMVKPNHGPAHIACGLTQCGEKYNTFQIFFQMTRKINQTMSETAQVVAIVINGVLI